VKPILVIGIGNPSRGDDALGPRLLDRLLDSPPPGVEALTDFQLQIEHVLDLNGRAAVVIVDAAIGQEAPFCFDAVLPAETMSFSTHALSPSALLAAYLHHFQALPPPTWLLGMRAEQFELGADLSPAANQSLDAAWTFLQQWLECRVRTPGIASA